MNDAILNKMATIGEGEIISIEASSPINIALIKYWGKVHEQMIIPANSSLSITIDQGEISTRTVV